VRRGPLSELARHRFHLIDAGRTTSALNPETKMKPDWGLLTYLHGAGRTETHKWLDGNRAGIGRRGTVDLHARYLAPPATHAAPAEAADPLASPILEPEAAA
jgi:NTE family protein